MSEEYGCDTGVNGVKENGGKGWVGKYDARDNPQLDEPLNFALFGLARQDEFFNQTPWREVDWDRTVLDLGPGNKIIPGAIRCEYPEYNFESTDFGPEAFTLLQDCLNDELEVINGNGDGTSTYRCALPFADDSVGGVFAVNILEHLWDPRPIMEEVARVLAPGAPFNIVVPHAHSTIYSQDLDHKKEFVIDSFKNWLQNGYWGPDRSELRLKMGAIFKFSIKEGNENIQAQLIKKFDSED